MIVDTNKFTVLSISPYFFFTLLGVFFSVSTYMMLIAFEGASVNKYLKNLIISWIGLYIGAVAFGIITNVLQDINTGNISLESFKVKSIVFYGGLTGMLITYILLQKCWYKKIDYYALDCLTVSIPVFHIFGRLACFFSGCCYGKKSEVAFSVRYVLRGESIVINRIPIQLIESLVNLFIFIILVIMWKKQILKDKLLFVYLSLYAVARFILEYFRGDIKRGIFFDGLSFSQIYSILIIIYVFITMIKINYKEKCKNEIV